MNKHEFEKAYNDYFNSKVFDGRISLRNKANMALELHNKGWELGIQADKLEALRLAREKAEEQANVVDAVRNNVNVVSFFKAYNLRNLKFVVKR